MSYKFDSEVLKALEELLKTETNYDVIIHVGKESDTKEFHAHSGFLCCRSNYFNSIISANNTIKIDGKYIINMPSITPQAFDVIITYFYTGHINMKNKTGVEILNMMIAFDDLKLNHLIELAEDYLIEHYRKFLQNDPIEFLQIINSHKVFNNNIRELCLKNIYSDPNILFNSVKFINLSAFLLEIILKQDDLILNEIDEIKIWENLIKWGLAKDEILDEDVSKWNQEKFIILEQIIHNFIPLIRFYDISSEDYYNKVRPYKKILSEESRDDIERFHMLHKSLLNKYSKRRLKRNIDSSLIITGTVDSSIINKEHMVLFANWIESGDIIKSIKHKNNTYYEFNLILRGSRDGRDSKSFHSKCDKKGATITVIKIENSNQLVGGYNPLDWGVRSTFGWSEQSSTPNSFLFSFNDNRNVGSGIISRPINFNGTVISDPNYGPNFGKDLFMKFGIWYSFPNSYTDINIPKYIGLNEYEVFQVKKNFHSKL
ncbi:hypothetical protein C1646_767496 [Rhizophagus diaphanus]|nr:hypothetical protein C1646_767496 [Rhizophagus diaphanus] [Rhizophagus sp. MUCL 43196]